MKKLSLFSILFTTFALTACNFFQGNSSSEYNPYPNPGGSSSSSSNFVLDENENGHDTIQELAERDGGVCINFTARTYVDGVVTTNTDIKINAIDNYDWATIHTTTNYGQNDIDITVGGATITHRNFFEVYYLAPESEIYEYYGNEYNPDIDFSIEQIEGYLTLDPVYMAALVVAGKGSIEYIAGEQCLTFTIDGDMFGDYTVGAKLKASFSITTHLLMKVELTSFTTDSYGLPVLNQYDLQVNSISSAEPLPTFVGSPY